MALAIKPVLLSQYEAALCALRECIAACPERCWDGPGSLIAKYPFWQVAYHTLCFVDCYLSPSNEEFKAAIEGPRPAGAPNFHPRGIAELEDEYPSRTFTRDELLAYTEVCRAKLRAVLGDGPGAETDSSLEGPSGFPWLPFSRAELHVYGVRHVQHHAGQLGASLRKAGAVGEEQLRWVKGGWR